MKKTLLTIALLITLPAVLATAAARDWAVRVPCEVSPTGDATLNTALKPLTFQQGTTPLISFDQYAAGRSVTASTNADAIFRFGPTSTNQYYVSVTNHTTESNGYLVQCPTLGTNTADTAWWYTVYFEESGYRYWTGNGRLTILKTTSTEDGLNWQKIISGGTPTNYVQAVEITSGRYQLYLVTE